MKRISKTILAALAIGLLSCGLFSQQTQASQINGGVALGGTVTLNNGGPLTSTQVTHWFSVGSNIDGMGTVLATSGDFSAFISPGDLATMFQPWTFGFAGGGPQAGLWTVGGFTFDLASDIVVTRTVNFLDIEGVGTVSGNGFDTTSATFTLQINQLGQLVAFEAITLTTPDGGTTVMLLGAALGVLGIARRALKR